ncbi:MAG: putative secreted oxidoreductase [Labilithrix sp.]|nr:putative secreted oxidoreductase [Labilithrix sp.]
MVGVFDPDRERAAAVAVQCGDGCRVCGDLDELAELEAEIANVCSPPSVHVVQAERLARGARRAVFVEKPVGVSHDDLARLERLAVCVPVVQWRAGRAIRAVRRAIAEGELGAAPVVSCDLAWGRDDAYVAARGASWGAGAVLSVGIHALDAALWALGQRVVETAGFSVQRPGAAAQTGAVGMLRLEGGALLSLRLSFDGGADTTRLTFCGGGITAVISGGEGDPTGSKVAWHALPGGAARVAALESVEATTRGATSSPLLVPYVGDAVRALREGRAPGDVQDLPGIASCTAAHRAALDLGVSG